MDKSRKSRRYSRIIAQLNHLLDKTDDPLCRMATINALLYHKMDGFFWTGFYLLNEGELRVGPYQGPLACQILNKNKGVCWAVINNKNTIVVEDVKEFPDHIACDPRSKSEIAVPLRDQKDQIIGVFDVDSKNKSHFDQTDAKFLEMIVKMVNANL
jgi:L-methionine (R)-S-oxide reductase